MHIEELTLYTQKLPEQHHFYVEVLNLPVTEQTSDAFTVQAGRTLLTLRESSEVTEYHFAFTIPRNKVGKARAWLEARATLLTQDGHDEFYSENWNSHGFYFRDAAGHILELIAHNDLPTERAGEFGVDDLLHISEIGLVTADVTEQVKKLGEAFQIEPYRNSIVEEFAAVGDIEGLFINVKIGRNWFPTNRGAIVSPVDVTITGVAGHSLQLLPYPYRVTVK